MEDRISLFFSSLSHEYFIRRRDIGNGTPSESLVTITVITNKKNKGYLQKLKPYCDSFTCNKHHANNFFLQHCVVIEEKKVLINYLLY